MNWEINNLVWFKKIIYQPLDILYKIYDDSKLGFLKIKENPIFLLTSFSKNVKIYIANIKYM